MDNNKTFHLFEFDMLRGILIICVVIGHTSLQIPYVDVYWFHMPAFFMISGYFMKSFHLSKNDIKKKFYRLVVPYFAYSILMFLLFHPEPLLKNILRTIYAGGYNITVYSYPWWFVNALFVSYIGISFLFKKVKTGGGMLISVVSLYLFMHLDFVWNLRPIPLPWSMDNALGGVMFFMIVGYYYKRVEGNRWINLFSVLPLLFVFLNHYWDYHLNMKSIEFSSLAFDFIVPCSFYFFEMFRRCCVMLVS